MKWLQDNCITTLLLAILALIATSFCLQFLPINCSLKYFHVPFAELLNILVLGGRIYWFVEYKNDKRKQKEFLQGIAERIIIRASDPHMYQIKNEHDIGHIRIVQRIIANELYMLEQHRKNYFSEKDLKYCNMQLNYYWSLISDNLHDLSFLQLSEHKLENHLANIINRLESMLFELYEEPKK